MRGLFLPFALSLLASCQTEEPGSSVTPGTVPEPTGTTQPDPGPPPTTEPDTTPGPTPPVATSDGDGDGVDADIDCDDADASVGGPAVLYIDGDGDGYGNELGAFVEDCNPVSGFIATTGDCDDVRSDVFPGAQELCDDVDQDCDSVVDNDPVDGASFCMDADGDTFGDPTLCEVACEPMADQVADSTDCDDLNVAINPAAIEACDELDNDCDGEVDEDVTGFLAWYDNDGDGYGDPNSGYCGAGGAAGVVDNDDDCVDTDPNIHPFGTEVCDGADNDCNGTPDNGVCSCPVAAYDGRPYQFCTSGLPWLDAEAACAADGYELASIVDDGENTWLADTASGFGHWETWWIGFTDADVEGTFLWSDGTAPVYSKWNAGEPNNSGDEDCTQIYVFVYGWHTKWNDEKCANSQKYICMWPR